MQDVAQMLLADGYVTSEVDALAAAIRLLAAARAITGRVSTSDDCELGYREGAGDSVGQTWAATRD